MDKRVENWVRSYRELADQVVAEHVRAMEEEFPDEFFPVRPPYRVAMYEHLLQIVADLNRKMDELLEESPDETDEELKATLMALQENYEREFALKVRKEPEIGADAG